MIGIWVQMRKTMGTDFAIVYPWFFCWVQVSFQACVPSPGNGIAGKLHFLNTEKFNDQ